ncbi:hypothetical protein V495_05443 [Pseudogymnoascus sp. VKM F-4514 (FW-929)]|nr:hypothetical protein V495_05443 [Pseudogymnoascus sp. VKM F-4514 (FW-929)]KFY61134.1 hypothetical protein V497_03080 [Pseudogymnoascus sp. VKM F-4516 (FW-969)]
MESDAVESDAVEGDVESDEVESDAVESDSWRASDAVESDAVEGGAVESDAVEGDAIEGDAIEGDDIKGDAVEVDAVEVEVVEVDAVDWDIRPVVGTMSEDQELCRHLLRSLDTWIVLELLPSSLHYGGTGLFSLGAIPARFEIFRSTPLVRCVDEGKTGAYCDYCHKSITGLAKVDVDPNPEGKVMFKAPLCQFCGQCGYCSDDCKNAAWELYHKEECFELKRNKSANLWTRMLYRVIAMHKQGSFSKLQWLALRNLWGKRGQDLAEVPPETVIAISGVAKAMIQSELETTEIADIYYKIARNTTSLLPPYYAGAGKAIDLVVSLINHSCDPNALIFYEGSQFRLRSLRRIQAGEEITIGYLPYEFGVWMRRELLNERYYFICGCNKCQEDDQELQSLAARGEFTISAFIEVQRKFTDFTRKPFGNKTIQEVVAAVRVISSPIFGNRPWPINIHPMADMRARMAYMYSSSGNHRQALIHALHSFLSRTARNSRVWVSSLHQLMKYLARAFILPEARSMMLREFMTGVQYQLMVEVKKVYGVDTAYATRMTKWHIDLTAGNYEFLERFPEAQELILRWAGVGSSKGIELSGGYGGVVL